MIHLSWDIAVTEDQTSLGQSLGPTLQRVCEGRLGAINWFRATWQHGGAATGFSTWDAGLGEPIACVVKLPVGYTEYFWTKRLGLTDPQVWGRTAAMALPTPRVLAGGFELGGYDFAWLVMERFEGRPLASDPTSQSVWEVFEAAAEFHAAAITELPVDHGKVPVSPDWGALIERGLGVLGDNEVAHSDRWRAGLGLALRHIDDLAARWDARPIDTWCHHDLHGRNAMRRPASDAEHPGRAALIDLAMVGAGHWVEDALYMERLNWGHEGRLRRIDPVEALARAREYAGLPTGEADLELADLRRVLMAATTPAYIQTEGEQRYLEAALGRLESLLPGLTG